MDGLTELLEGPRARGAFVLRAVMDPPWSVRIEDQAPLTLLSVMRGEAWIVPDMEKAQRIGPGDIALIRGPEHYLVADDEATEPMVIIHPDQSCTTLDGRPLRLEMQQGVRTWGNSNHGATSMVIGTYQMRAALSKRLLNTLPALTVLAAADFRSPVTALLNTEIDKNQPGQEVVLDRLLDLLLIGAVRAWFSQREEAAPGWYRAHSDPVVGPVLKLMRSQPARQWTVAMLAAAVGVSRAALARRFTDVIGESPMAFLADLRLDLAADLLREPDATIGSVARRVGYSTPFALSAAFKRVRGISPQEHRTRDAEPAT